MKDAPIYLKKTIRTLRLDYNISLDKAAEMLGISTPTYRKWEQDSTKIPIGKIAILEKMYNISCDFIFFGSELTYSEQIKELMVKK